MKTQINDWNLTTWYGNPDLGIIAYMKIIRDVKVWVWEPTSGGFNFTINAGPNSDRSYTGCFFGDDTVKTIEDAINGVELKEANKELF